MKILVADDSSATRFLLSALVADWGYTAVQARDGAEAWELLRGEQAPKLALLDWMMPGMTGLEVCARLKEEGLLPQVYTILVTSKTGKQSIVAGLDAGADDFLSKPVQAEELRSRLAAGRRVLTSQAALAERNEELHALFSALPDAVWSVDADGRWTRANAVALELFQLQGVPYEGRSAEELGALLPGVHAHPTAALAECLRQLSASDERAFAERELVREELETPATGAGRRVIEVIKAPLFHADGRRRGLIAIGRDITVRKQLEERLRSEARSDALTGLVNRGHLDREIARALYTRRRYEQPVSLCLCDIDLFKRVNDTHGHAVGDQVLAAFASIIREELRDSDTAGRYGGDELCMIFPSTAAPASVECLERIRRRLAARRFPTSNGGEVRVTASFGVAEADPDSDDGAVWIAAADNALYKAKAAGRDRIEVFGG